MKQELQIILNENNTVTATLDMDGEFHEEHFPEMTPKALLILVNRLETETEITPTFIKTDSNIPELVYDTKFLQVFNDNGYIYSQRLGKDSVAFILFDRKKVPDGTPYGLVTEYKPPIKSFLTTAFGGSLDKDVPMEQIVLEEVREEAGYTVTPDRINQFGAVMVSTQSNQVCHLFAVDITDIPEEPRQPESLAEVFASVEWLSHEDILKLQDWKAPTIISKFLKFGYN